MDENLLESVGEHVTDVLGISVTDVGHQSLSLEATTDTVVDTLRLAPVGLDTVVSERGYDDIEIRAETQWFQGLRRLR